MALSAILLFPFVPLFLASFSFPKHRTCKSDSCSSQIPDGPLQQSYFIRILRAMARSSPSRSCKIKQKNEGGGGGMKDESASVSAIIYTHLPLVLLLLDLHLSSFLIRLGCRLNK